MKKQKHLRTLVYYYLPYDQKMTMDQVVQVYIYRIPELKWWDRKILSYVQLLSEFRDTLNYMRSYQKIKEKRKL